METKDSFGIYLHTPYCRSRCRYCDFYSRGGSQEVPAEYVAALLRELKKNSRRPDTLYFGGGTPSLLSPGQVSDLIDAANPVAGAEITLEANPDTVTRDTLCGYAKAGVTRISFGVQSADDTQLKRLGRTHTAATAAKALAWAQTAGFEEICGDIMLALPNYTNDEFDKTLCLLQQGGCTHISAYLLKIEPGTAFAKKVPGNLPDADTAAAFYLYACEKLEYAGYKQYEISNFALPGHQGRHNLLYWNCKEYMGIGPSAHSCMNNVRSYWPSDTNAFIQGTLARTQDGVCCAEDYLILRLRLTEGLEIREYIARGARPFTSAQECFLEQCVKHGYARYDKKNLALTPRGMIVQSAILTELI